MAAMLLDRPYLEISPTQAKSLAVALANVAKQYQVTINPAIMAWIGLIGTGSAIYAPMIAFEFARNKHMAAKRAAARNMATAGNQPSQVMVAQTAQPAASAEPVFKFQ